VVFTVSATVVTLASWKRFTFAIFSAFSVWPGLTSWLQTADSVHWSTRHTVSTALDRLRHQNARESTHKTVILRWTHRLAATTEVIQRQTPTSLQPVQYTVYQAGSPCLWLSNMAKTLGIASSVRKTNCQLWHWHQATTDIPCVTCGRLVCLSSRCRTIHEFINSSYQSPTVTFFTETGTS